MTRRLAFAVLTAAVLLGGFFIAVTATLTDDPVADW